MIPPELVAEAIEIFAALAKRMAHDGMDPKAEAQRIAESYAARARTEASWSSELKRRFPNSGV